MKIFILLCIVSGALGARVCGRNEQYYECGTACPRTCDNLNNPPKICPAMCVIGCQCSEGYVKASDGSCVLPSQCPGEDRVELSSDICELHAESGVCFCYFPRYHYNKATGECKMFIYGGCGGNDNNFKSLAECQSICGEKKGLSESDCNKYPDSGVCDAYMPRYYFDTFSGTCKTFIYGGCGGNNNNFRTEEECIAKCVE